MTLLRWISTEPRASSSLCVLVTCNTCGVYVGQFLIRIGKRFFQCQFFLIFLGIANGILYVQFISDGVNKHLLVDDYSE